MNDNYKMKNQHNYVHIFYREVSGMVSKVVFSEKEAPFGSFGHDDYIHVLDGLEMIKKAETENAVRVQEDYFMDALKPFQPLAVTVGSRMTYSYSSFQNLETYFAFGRPFYRTFVKDRIEKQYQQLSVDEQCIIDNRKTAYYHFQKSKENIFVKVAPNNDFDWNLNNLSIHPISDSKDVKIINPNDYNSVWEDGCWVDAKWIEKGRIANGNKVLLNV